jgi:hypothetical protein
VNRGTLLRCQSPGQTLSVGKRCPPCGGRRKCSNNWVVVVCWRWRSRPLFLFLISTTTKSRSCRMSAPTMGLCCSSEVIAQQMAIVTDWRCQVHDILSGNVAATLEKPLNLEHHFRDAEKRTMHEAWHLATTTKNLRRSTRRVPHISKQRHLGQRRSTFSLFCLVLATSS